MKYNVCDKVKIREDLEVGETYGADKFVCGMEDYRGKTAIITNRYDNTYRVNIDGNDIGWNWTDEMFEDVMEKKTPKTQEEVNKHLLANSVRTPANLLDIEQTLQNDGLKLPEDVRVNSSGISGIAFIKWYETEQYPKTYFECCKELGFTVGMSPRAYGYKSEEISALQKLIVCRNAYWKIAGGWTLDYDADELYFICNERGHIVKAKGITDYNTILAFPTEEMRDEFYENFKDLIEHCKEFL